MGRKAVLFCADPDEGWWSERVALHPIHEEGELPKIVGALEVLVGTVAFAVYTVKRRLKLPHTI